MKVESILKSKGRDVQIVTPEVSLVLAVHQLSSRSIGALVVSHDGRAVDGLLSEREIVRGLARHGAALLDLRVRDVMLRDVPVCSSQDTIRDAMAEMTRSRNRHLPVVDGGALAGLISIGDVVKHRLEELELEALVLRDAALRHR
ncbi:MAG: CBS domain-containing protein [Actinomycetes bacterium]